MLLLIGIHALAAICAPMLIKWIGRRAFLLLSLVPLGTFGWTLAQTSAVLRGDYPQAYYLWVPYYGFDLSFRLDILSWVMACIVSAVGALVLIYCSRYFSESASGIDRFAAVFVAFAGAMFGLVTTDNTIALYLFWELTTVFSFLLIGHAYQRQSSRRAAMQALTLTTMGGLAMLVGLVMLGMVEGGSFTISTLLENARNGALWAGAPPGFVEIAIILVLAGALTKSAQFPLHFWLPAAMAAPTPVSAYLHAAAMVKAGVYLVARFAPEFSHLVSWQVLVVGVGLLTMLFGGFMALKQHDLKLLAAFGTVSQLGFLLALVGYGERGVALAGLVLVISHSMFKACIFLTVGIIDKSMGTRDLRELSGLGRQMPLLAVVATFAIASMAGLPPTFGYLGKEAMLASLYESGTTLSVLVLVTVVVGSMITLVYGLRFLWGAFAVKPGVEPSESVTNSRFLIGPPVLLGLASLLAGLVPGLVEKHLSPFARNFSGQDGHLTLWAGFTAPTLITGLIIVAGVAVFVWIGRRYRPIEDDPKTDRRTAAGVYRHVIRLLNQLAVEVTAVTQRGSLPVYLQVMLIVVIFAPVISAIALAPQVSFEARPADSISQGIVAALICVSVFLIARARRRMKAILLLSFVGYAIAILFALQGAPDLALTQVVAETISLIILILVLRRLPSHFSNRPWPASRWIRIVISILVGLIVAGLVYAAVGARIHPPVTVDYPQEVYEFGYGRNIVNVTLVDTRAWDTIGEISVLLAAASGVASLLFIRQRVRSGTIDLARLIHQAQETPTVWGNDSPDEKLTQAKIAHEKAFSAEMVSSKRASSRGRQWLSATSTLAPTRRSLVFEVGARLLFYPLIVFSVFLLFAGHNNPGGGFAGGVVAGIAFAIRYLAGGRFELSAAAPVNPGHVLGLGMITATTAALVPVTVGGTILQTTVFNFTLPVFDEVHLATALFFDIGVYLIVVGLILDILQALGSEVDRQSEIGGLQAPDVSPRSNQVADDDPVTVSPIAGNDALASLAESATKANSNSGKVGNHGKDGD